MKATRKIVIWLVGAILLVALGVIVSFWTFRQIEEASAVRMHTYGVLDGARELLSELKDAEAGQRGYLLTGDDAFLVPYSAVYNRIKGDLNKLSELTLVPAAQQHLDAVVSLLDAELAQMSQTIELRRNRDLAAALAAVRSGHDRRTMDAIRTEMNAFTQIEKGVLAQREAEFQSNMRNLFTIIVATSLLTLLFAVAFAWLIYREIQQRFKNLVHLETRHLLEIQEQTNIKLNQTNVTLQVSEERLAVTLNSIGDAVIATDADARVSLMNPLAEKLTGWTRIEAIGRPVAEIIHIINQETRQLSIIPVMQTLAHGAVQGLANHAILISRDGNEYAIADSCAPILDRDGQVAGAVLVFRDVTERKRLDHVLHEKNIELERATFVAEKANLAKSVFLSRMSHELRTPLNAILGFAQLLETGSPPPTAAQLVRLKQIINAGWYLLELINEILDLALIEAGRLSLSCEPVSLNEVLHECQVMIESQAQQRGIKMTFPRFDTPRFVSADRTRLKQVLINLLTNALKYNRVPGTVEVECTVTIAGSIRISIKDSGAGLPPEKLVQLFQPFNRLGQENGTEEGTGIGLVVAKQLVELMGGAIGVKSTVGVGSEFWIELVGAVKPQLADENSSSAESAPPIRGNVALHTLLYVEDNPANLMLVEQIIAEHPQVRMLGARDGNLGISLARTHLPDVILMDINLPGISGFEALTILRADPATARIPVIAISANAMLRDIEKGLEAGFFRYLTKPIKINEFMNALDDALKDSERVSVKTTAKEKYHD